MLDGVHPSYFACAPEFRQENWNYVNTGVMVINVPALRADFDRFMAFALDMMERRGPQFTDQIVYNEFLPGCLGPVGDTIQLEAVLGTSR